MWREPRATYEGKYLFVRDAVLEPKPLQKPRSRILIGGGGEKITLRIVAREADMSNFFGAGPQAFARKLDVLRDHCREVGRDINEIEVTGLERIILAPTAEQAEEKWRQRGSPARDGYRGLLGTPEDAVKLIRAYEDVGAQALFFMVPNYDAETRDLLAKEVMPAFK